MQLKGRTWIGVWLLFFLGVLAVVVARQTASVVAAADLRAVQVERAVLEARRFRLYRRIQDARSRSVLVPRAERLGLRSASDSEVVSLEVKR